MWPLEKPRVDARFVLLTCINEQIRSITRELLEPYMTRVADAEKVFDLAVRTGVVHTLDSGSFGTGNSTVNKELQKVYTGRIAKIGRPGRPIYDELILAARHCPFCGHLPVHELDHYLPKDRYQLLAVAPLNLMPACKPCNSKKRNRNAQSSDQVLLHPYYDEVAGSQWLGARVEEQMPASVTFFVNAPDSWPATLTSRVKYHFDFFEINALYSVQAATELSGIKLAMCEQFDADGTAAVVEHLSMMARSRRRPSPNRWDAAMYEALARSEWYCGGGFKYVP